MITTALVGLAAVLGLMMFVWVVSLAKRDVSIVDPMWGVAFFVLALVYVARSSADGSRTILMLVLIGVWALRLFGYLAWRKWGESEDFRYKAMRERGGPRFKWIALIKIFWLQGVLAWVISAPLLAVAHNGGNIGVLDLVAIALWTVGMYFETVGDLQLARFKADASNAGKVMDKGLWAYTRHPNYFGDATVWWAFFLLALAAGGWWSFYGPLLMTFLLLKVSGVSLLERSLESKKPGYEAYARRTSAFLPRPPRRAG